jgi:uncharacterized membrane protein
MNLWPKIHGASTHFPLALVLAAMLFESLGFLAPPKRKEGLRAAGRYSIQLGAIGVFPAVLSGLFLTKGEIGGHGVLLYHHLFVWPSFAAIVGLGVWRILAGERPSARGITIYSIALLITAILVTGAGYWGGELLLAS